MHPAEEPPVAYVVGLWEAIIRAAHFLRLGRRDLARKAVAYTLRYLAYQARRGNWRAVRMSTMRPYRYESVGPAPRCGSGWTPAGARRDLARRLEASR